MAYLSIVALIPLAAVLFKSLDNGADGFWDAVSNPQAVAALRLTLIASVIVVLINAVFGTLIAWVLVRDEFPGKSIVNSLIDLPFALPTIVAGLTLLAFYGPDSPVGVNVAFTRTAVARGQPGDGVPPDHPSQPDAGDHRRRRAGVRARRGRVRLAHPDHGQHPLQDPGGVRVHLLAGGERQPGRRLGRLGGSAAGRARGPADLRVAVEEGAAS
jgi:hypothetical protein